MDTRRMIVGYIGPDNLIQFDRALRLAERADLARRTRAVLEETGEFTPRMIRQWNEIERDATPDEAA